MPCNLTADVVEGADLVPALQGWARDPGRPSDETVVHLWPPCLGQGQRDDTSKSTEFQPLELRKRYSLLGSLSLWKGSLERPIGT